MTWFPKNQWVEFHKSKFRQFFMEFSQSKKKEHVEKPAQTREQLNIFSHYEDRLGQLCHVTRLLGNDMSLMNDMIIN